MDIACFNGPSSHVFAGSEAAIEALEYEIIEHTSSIRDIKVRRLEVTHG